MGYMVAQGRAFHDAGELWSLPPRLNVFRP